MQIESEQAVREAAEIASVEGVDFVFVGPGDLAASLGVPFGDERVNEKVTSVLAAAREAGRPAGIWAPSTERAARWLGTGFQLVILGLRSRIPRGGPQRCPRRARGRAPPVRALVLKTDPGVIETGEAERALLAEVGAELVERPC